MFNRNPIAMIVCCCVACACLTPNELRSQEKAAGEFRSLFNEKNLDGWKAVNTASSTWSVKDGLLVCTGKPIGELRTERMYQNFIFEIEWRHLVPRGNAGIFIWADDITARGQPFHRGIEVQVLENAYGDNESHTTHGDIFPIHGATMIPVNGRRGSSRAFPTESRSKPSPEWNHYRIECRDGDISLAVNGKMVTQGKQCSPRKGYICLESEGGVVHYRNIRIQELPDSPIEPAHVAIADRGYSSLYNGIDLTGWSVDAKAQPAWQPNDWILTSSGSAASADATIATTESFGDVGVIIDVRFDRSQPATMTLGLRDKSSGAISLDPDDAKLKPLLERAGQWNRFEGSIRGTEVTIQVNGKPWHEKHELKNVPSNGPITLQPSGPIAIANIYVKHLP